MYKTIADANLIEIHQEKVNYRHANVCTIRVVVHGTQIMVSFEKIPGHNFCKLSLKIYTLL